MLFGNGSKGLAVGLVAAALAMTLGRASIAAGDDFDFDDLVRR